MQHEAEAGHRALAFRRGRELVERRPDFGLVGWRDLRDALLQENLQNPFHRPVTLVLTVDVCERLERNAVFVLVAKIVKCPANTSGQRARRAAFVENVDLRVLVTSELRFDRVEENRFAGARDADDHRVADVANVEIEAERRTAGGLTAHKRRRVQMAVPCLARPNGGKREHVREVQAAHVVFADVVARHAGD